VVGGVGPRVRYRAELVGSGGGGGETSTVTFTFTAWHWHCPAKVWHPPSSTLSESERTTICARLIQEDRPHREGLTRRSLSKMHTLVLVVSEHHHPHHHTTITTTTTITITITNNSRLNSII
jgi:hypothetical protein